MQTLSRLDKDQYFTDQKLIEPLFKHIDIFATEDFDHRPNVWEPCCGDGRLAQAIEDKGCAVFASDIDPGLGYADDIKDATQPWSVPRHYDRDYWKNPDWVITNPPYRQPDCQKIIENSWKCCGWGMAMLLRLTYLEPCRNRANFLRSAWLSDLIVLNPRPRFRTDREGTDKATVAWFVWQKNAPEHRFTRIINETDWAK